MIPIRDFFRYRALWQGVLGETIASEALSAEFVGQAIDSFARGGELLCLASENQKLIAATLVARNSPFSWQTFQPSQMPLGPWLQARGEDVSTLARTLLAHLPGPAAVFAVTQLDPDFYPPPNDPCSTVLEFVTTGQTELHCRSLDEFFATRGDHGQRKLVSELKRRIRNAEEQLGTMTLKVERTPDVAERFVHAYADMESRGWKSALGTALTPGDGQTRFYASLMKNLAARDAARMYTLAFGGVPVAYQMAVVGAQSLILLKTTYDSELGKLGPGVILQQEIIAHALEEPFPVRKIEMYGPLNDSQKLWATRTRTMYHVNVYRHPLLTRLHRWRLYGHVATGKKMTR